MVNFFTGKSTGPDGLHAQCINGPIRTPHSTAQHSTAQDKTRKETGEPTNLPNNGTRTLEIYSTETRDCDEPVPERVTTISRGVQKINEGLQALRKTVAAAAAVGGGGGRVVVICKEEEEERRRGRGRGAPTEERACARAIVSRPFMVNYLLHCLVKQPWKGAGRQAYSGIPLVISR